MQTFAMRALTDFTYQRLESQIKMIDWFHIIPYSALPKHAGRISHPFS